MPSGRCPIEKSGASRHEDQARAAKTKESKKLTLKDRLSHLTHYRACQLLGPDGPQLIRQGAAYYEIDIDRDVYFRGDLFRLKLRGAGGGGKDAVVTITTMAEARDRLRFNCTACQTICEHIGAAVSLVLEEKTALGLAAEPDERRPLETLSEQELLEQALSERQERAQTEKFRLSSSDPQSAVGRLHDHQRAFGKDLSRGVAGRRSGAIRSARVPTSAPTRWARANTFLHVLRRVRRRFPASARQKPYRNREAFVHVLYGEELTLHLQLPDRPDPELVKAVGPLADGPIDDVRRLVDCLSRLDRLGRNITVYPDAEELIQRRLFERHMSDRMAEIQKDPARHPLRKQLLKVELLPYQLEGIAFAAGVGRAILADDMGLGKTIQGVGVAEILAREAGIGRVLVVCPASLKSQWRSEIHRFSDRTVQLVIGGAAERARQYDNDSFFTVCNYEQVLRDILAIERVRWDLIILDEGQRIKNWESKTARVIKGLKSPFALVLSGTPLENRLDELYSVVQFVDDRRLPPAFRFFHRHRVVDEKGKVLGYKNLDQLRENLRPILRRRTRESVLQQLPPRTSEIVRIPPTDEQSELHDAPHAHRVDDHPQGVHLRDGLAAAAKGPVDVPHVGQQHVPGGEESAGLFEQAGIPRRVVRRPVRRAGSQGPAVLRMDHHARLDRADAGQTQVGLRAAGRLGAAEEAAAIGQSLPRRPAAAGCLSPPMPARPGLNLQAANTVINVDLPWNPAVLEQRVGPGTPHGPAAAGAGVRAGDRRHDRREPVGHAFGQARLGLGGLGSRLRREASGLQERDRGVAAAFGSAAGGQARSAAGCDEARGGGWPRSERLAEQRDRVAAAGGEMLGAVFNFLGELVSQDQAQPPDDPLVAQVRNRLSECVEEDSSGRQRLTVTLPDRPRWTRSPKPWPGSCWPAERLPEHRPKMLDGLLFGAENPFGWSPLASKSFFAKALYRPHCGGRSNAMSEFREERQPAPPQGKAISP